MFVSLNVPSFGELLRKCVYSFRNRFETSDNIIIHVIYLSPIELQTGIWVWWREILSRNYTIVLCIILYFYFFFNRFFYINLYDLCIICTFFFMDCVSEMNIIMNNEISAPYVVLLLSDQDT